MTQLIIAAAIVVGVGVAYFPAHLALIEVGREVAVVYEPTPTGVVHKARFWIVDDGRYSWIHPGNANAQWWVQHMDANPIVEIDRGGEVRRYRARPDPEAHARVHQLLREKYGVADRWVRTHRSLEGQVLAVGYAMSSANNGRFKSVGKPRCARVCRLR